MIFDVESYALRFTFFWIIIRTEWKIVFLSILFTNFQHLLESTKRRSKKQGIIGVSKNTKKSSTDPTTDLVLPELGEKIVHIKTISKS